MKTPLNYHRLIGNFIVGFTGSLITAAALGFASENAFVVALFIGTLQGALALGTDMLAQEGQPPPAGKYIRRSVSYAVF